MFQVSSFKFQRNRGFTLVEIMVASTIFVIVAASMLSLFNYVLKINRRSEALRQASQDMRNFVEFLVKEIRNGQIDYYITNGSYSAKINSDNNVPCGPSGTPGVLVSNPTLNTYAVQENKLGLINSDGIQECFFFADNNGTYIPLTNATPFSAPSGAKYTLVLAKSGVENSPGQSNFQILNPPNARIENLMFLIRPLCNPYTSSCVAGAGTALPKTQPLVSIIIKFVVQLPTGEQVPINYQTSVSSNKYDIPNQ